MKNITVKDFKESNRAVEYAAVFSHLKPSALFAGKEVNINALPYSNVKYCIKLLNKSNEWPSIAELFTICWQINEDAFWSAPITEYFAASRFILKALSDAANKEAKLLHAPSSDDNLWNMAGADRLKPFSDTLPLLNLGKALGQYPFDLGRKPYGEIITLMVMTKTQSEVEQEYLKLKK